MPCISSCNYWICLPIAPRDLRKVAQLAQLPLAPEGRRSTYCRGGRCEEDGPPSSRCRRRTAPRAPSFWSWAVTPTPRTTCPATGSLTIGRGESNTVRIDDPLASRAHACLHVAEVMSLEDLGSVNGTRIKDQPIQRGERVSIRIGDTIQIGSSVLIVQRRTAPVEEMRPETLRDAGLAATEDRRRSRRGARRCRRCTRWPSAPPRGRSTSSSPARPASARSSWRRRCIARRPGATGRTSASTARRCPRRCWRASCSVTSAGRSPARWRPSRACWRRPPAARCFSTRWASCRWPRRPSC